MKKTYMNPTLKVVVLKAKAQMLAGSENMAGLRIFCVHTLKSHSHLKH